MRIEPPMLVAWPVAPPAGGGLLKAEPEDFRVVEIPAYPPNGEGDFLMLEVEKRDLKSDLLVQTVADRVGVSPRDIGVAGRKDRRAVTRQWMTVPARGRDGDVDPSRIDGPIDVAPGATLRVVSVERHSKKLRTGHLAGNRFEIVVRDVPEASLEGLSERAAAIGERGFANVFGPQRFGYGSTVKLGLQALGGRRIKGRRKLSLAISAVQSALFNTWLAERAADGLMETAIDGDVLQKRTSGGTFTSTEPDTDSARIAAGELVVTGPIPGHRPNVTPDGLAAEREARVLAAAELTPESFKSVGKLAQGTRRPAIAWPEGLEVAVDGRDVRLVFTLPSGTYATVLCELLCGPPRERES